MLFPWLVLRQSRGQPTREGSNIRHQLSCDTQWCSKRHSNGLETGYYPHVRPMSHQTQMFAWSWMLESMNFGITMTHTQRERVIPMLAQPLMRHVISYGILLAKTRSGVCPSTLLENPRKRMGTERLRRRDVRDLERLLKARPRGGDHEGILRATCDSSVSTVSTSKKWGFHEDFMEFVWDWMGFDVLAAEQSLWEIMIFDQ